ncbi:isoprenoid synthase domain-containing protein [Mycena epipterygia]|nr:isoprenoid synthase domain-containing protein [Mycena epipterygia]
MSTIPDYAACIRTLLTDIGYRRDPLPPHDADYWGSFHTWMLYTLGPVSPWSVKQLTELEHAAGGIVERGYPYASTPQKLLFAKLTAIAILIDDSIEDEVMYLELLQFSRRLYLGEPQQNGMLVLYHATMQELSEVCGNDAVLRGLVIVPWINYIDAWINYIDACLMEKGILASEQQERAEDSPSSHDMSPAYDSNPRSPRVDGLTPDFPHYLRRKSGAAEAYAAGIFKANKEQCFPLTKYIRVLPDLAFFIEVMNDVLSFHKEELAGETHNFIHFRTRTLSASGARGSGIAGQWTPNDTLRLLCDELRKVTQRIDGLLRLEDYEKKIRGEGGLNDIDDIDVEIAKQWRGWRDGYISWHFECRRYKLESMELALLPTND